MGAYRNIVITTAGETMLADILSNSGTITFTKLQTSAHEYPVGTDLTALTSLQDVKQETAPSSSGVTSVTDFFVSTTVDNSSVSVGYTNYTLGLLASDGVNEILFAVSTAVEPDYISAFSGVPSTYTYTITFAISSTADITINIDQAGILRVSSIVDNLTSNTTTAPLSAKQGKVLAGMIAPTEQGTATAAHYTGDTIIYNGALYRVIADIAVNDILTVGTNITATTVAAELNNARDLTKAENVLAIGNGGTGASDAPNARSNLGLGSAAEKNSTTSITNGGSDLPTAGAVYNYTKQVYISSTAPSSNQSNYLWVKPS